VTFTVLANVRTNVTGGLTNTVVATVPAGCHRSGVDEQQRVRRELCFGHAGFGGLQGWPGHVYAGTNFSYSITVTNFTLGIASNVVSATCCRRTWPS